MSSTIAIELIDADTSSRIGGLPILTAEQIPRGKDGKPMLFLGQIDFAEVPPGVQGCPSAGILSLFINRSLDLSNPKDRWSFSCVWNAHPPATPAQCETACSQVGIRFLPPATVDSASEQPAHQLFGDYPEPKYSYVKEIAAFCANGISWSSKRREDSCYSHLVENAQTWLLLWKISDLTNFGWNLHGHDLLVLVSQSDLQSSNLERARLISTAVL